MDSIPVRELNQHTSAVLARVANGESLEITVSGHPAARLVPIEDSTNLRTDLIRRGRLVPATNPGPLVLPPGEPDLTTDSTEVISDLREERL
ncbi:MULTISPECIES: type II toxin-antitoxin system prevent-host-death family antitoxin [Kribbella]|jgi:prevent-host-death family protein|uniref:Antitoxin n=1 Tax=Kribbella karoonensis TaxID=324851 RepID=A0ABN2D9F3_9ACTN|nr:type II toxin-antitoxin system prevent-host-death family antitoxin [Kribbella sp.]HZX07029.1 type II toxin-antitoxin system prevent-host-death family antitoxin [Kribbella sp.]